MKTTINAQIVAHSVNEQRDELISVLATFPRIILAEVNTHRMLSKNTSSSRAIPFNKMVETIQNDPFIPIAWQKHHSGMQGSEYWDVTIKGAPGELDHTNIPAKWLRARDTAVTMAEVLYDGPQGVTKQLCNRLLEPFMWTTMLITGSKSGWDNFFHLRCPQYQLLDKDGDEIFNFVKSKKDWIKEMNMIHNNVHRLEDYSELDWLKANKGQAEIHMMALAECIWDAYNESTPKVLQAGEWHIPFQDTFDISELSTTTKKLKIPVLSWEDGEMVKVWVSTAMAARTSYTIVGEEKGVDYEALIGLHNRLLSQDPPHSSPLEHCARTMSGMEYFEHFYKMRETEPGTVIKDFGWCNNFKGFIPYRYMVDNGNQTSKD
jgi:hypothetical protein